VVVDAAGGANVHRLPKEVRSVQPARRALALRGLACLAETMT